MNCRIWCRLSLMFAGLMVVTGVSGCGFKSDLFIPETDSATPLFEPDTQPTVETEEALPILPTATTESEPDSIVSESMGASEGIHVDITTIATDGRILVSPGDEDGEDESSVGSEGVPVDISDLFPE